MQLRFNDGRVVNYVDFQKQLKTVRCSMVAQDHAVKLPFYCYANCLDGCRFFVWVRDVQAHLGLNILARYANHWVARGWSSWRLYCTETLKLPESYFIPNLSAKTLAVTPSDPRPAQEQYCISYVALFALLSRLACTLKPPGNANAKRLLDTVCQAVVGSLDNGQWPADVEPRAQSCARSAPSPAAITIAVVRGMVHLKPFGVHFKRFGKDIKRLKLEQTVVVSEKV